MMLTLEDDKQNPGSRFQVTLIGVMRSQGNKMAAE